MAVIAEAIDGDGGRAVVWRFTLLLLLVEVVVVVKQGNRRYQTSPTPRCYPLVSQFKYWPRCQILLPIVQSLWLYAPNFASPPGHWVQTSTSQRNITHRTAANGGPTCTQQGNGALQTPPPSPPARRARLVSAPISCRIRCSRYDAAGASASARQHNDVTRCNGIDVPPYGPLCAIMASFVKPEVHNASQHRPT